MAPGQRTDPSSSAHIKMGSIGSQKKVEPEPLAIPSVESGLLAFSFPSVIPGANHVLFSMTTTETEVYDQSSIAILDLETGEYRVLLEGGFAPQYAPSGHLVFARSGGSLRAAFLTVPRQNSCCLEIKDLRSFSHRLSSGFSPVLGVHIGHHAPATVIAASGCAFDLGLPSGAR